MRAYPSLLLSLLIASCVSDAKIDRVNAPPVVEILAPAPDSTFRQGDGDVVFGGTALDTYDSPPELTITWTLDDGAPDPATADAEGVVAWSLDSQALTVGTHVVELLAVDTDGASASAQITFTVGGPLGPPYVEITAPDDGSTFLVDQQITFVGLATDTTSPASELTFSWSSSIDGTLYGAISGDGQSALITDDLSPGTATITLSVTDGDGEVGSDSIVVTIEDGGEDPVPPEPGDLIFSEVMVNPNGAADEDGEWVELYNTSGSTLDITGYSFHDDGADFWVFDASVSVGPHGYLVLCANPNPAINGGVPCDGWFYRNPAGEQPTEGLGHGSGIAIANNDDELELTSPTGVDIDIFDYNDTDSDPIIAGASFGLDPDHLDGVENDDVSNWCVQTTLLDSMEDPGTPGLPNDPCF